MVSDIVRFFGILKIRPHNQADIKARVKARVKGDYLPPFFLWSINSSSSRMTHMLPIFSAVSNDPLNALCLAVAGSMPWAIAHSLSVM